MNIYHNTYQLPVKLPRNSWGVTTNTSFISSSNDLFATQIGGTISSENNSSSGSGSADYISDFLGATAEANGIRGLVPAPLAGQQDYYLHGDGTWYDIPVMIGTSGNTPGKKGLAPAPQIGAADLFLKGNGEWAAVPIMIGANDYYPGKEGLVPIPRPGEQDYYLTGGGNWVMPRLFSPATSTQDGQQGEVPGPTMGESSYYLMEATGDWVFNAAQKWLHEWPDEIGFEPSGLGIDGDFNVTKTLSTLNLEVEGRAHFWELVIDRVKANGGQLLVSPSNFKVDEIGPTIIRWIDEEPMNSILAYRPDIKRALENHHAVAIKCQRVYMHSRDDRDQIVPSVTIGDMMRCRSFNIGPGHYDDVYNKDYWTFVLGVGSEQFKATPPDGDVNSSIGNYIDLAVCVLTENDAYPLDTLIPQDENENPEIPEDYVPEYTIADLKDISEQVRTGNNDRMEEFPNQSEMDQITVAVLNLPAIPIPDELIDVDDYIFHYDPEINNTDPIHLPYSPSSDTWASELEKYNTNSLYADWRFGYGVIDISEGDELACLGHLVDIDRRNAIILSSNKSIDPTVEAPAIAQYSGIDIFGLSISEFRLTTIAKNGNYFYGYFGIDTGGNPNSYMTLGDAITMAVTDAKSGSYSFTQQAYDMLFSYVTDNYGSLSYIKQTKDDILLYVDQSYGLLYSALNLTYDSISTYVANEIAGANTYAYETAYGFYREAWNAYSYSLTYTGQTADSIYQYIGNEMEGVYTYAYDTAYGFYREAWNAYSYTLSYIEQTAEYIAQYVGSDIAGANTYAYQTAYGFYQQSYNAYTYTLTYISQTYNSISTYVADTYNSTSSYVNQLSDRIDMAVTSEDLELVGIHLDGLNSTVDIVGSLAVKQNGDGDIDTFKVYDEDNILRVEISPEEIPALSDIGVNDITYSLSTGWSTPSLSISGTSFHLEAERTFFPIYTGDSMKVSNVEWVIHSQNAPWFNPNERSTSPYQNFRQNCYFSFNITTSDNSYTFYNYTSSSFRPGLQDTANGGYIISLNGPGEIDLGTVTSVNTGKNLKMKLWIDFTLTDHGQNQSWVIDSNSVYGTLIYTPTGGIDSTLTKIGSNGFFYANGGNQYLYSGIEGLELKNGNSKISVNNNYLGIYHNSYSTAYNYITVGRNTNETLADVIHYSISGGTAGGGAIITLDDTAYYGYGRELIILGTTYTALKPLYNPIIINRRMDGRTTAKNAYVPVNNYLVLDDFNTSGYSYSYYTENTYTYYKSNGTLRLLSMSDGWYIIQ